MCHRYSLQTAALVAEMYPHLLEEVRNWTPRYNVALTQKMPVIIRRQGSTALERFSFGFHAPARTAGERPLLLGNARAETLAAKPTFRDALLTRRCLVPADGFYEWEKQGDTRLPHYFALPDGRPFYFAGLWSPPKDEAPGEFCIVTTTANAVLSPIHDRMPVMLGPNSGPAWLGDEPLPDARVAQLCRPLPADLLAGRRVDPRMNNVRYEAADCTAPI
jgi:putative SOS response-associated peptidase YedK